MKKEDLLKLKIAFIILGVGLLLTIFCIVKAVAPLSKISETSKNIKDQSLILEDKKRLLESKKKEMEKPVVEKEEQLYKAFFENKEGLAAEASLGMELEEILQEMRRYKIKVRGIEYIYDPEDDNFVKGAKGAFQVCRVKMEMIGKYVEFRNFMRALYSHKHFLEIERIEVSPYMKDKRILLINLDIKIYAKN